MKVYGLFFILAGIVISFGCSGGQNTTTNQNGNTNSPSGSPSQSAVNVAGKWQLPAEWPLGKPGIQPQVVLELDVNQSGSTIFSKSGQVLFINTQSPCALAATNITMNGTANSDDTVQMTLTPDNQSPTVITATVNPSNGTMNGTLTGGCLDGYSFSGSLFASSAGSYATTFGAGLEVAQGSPSVLFGSSLTVGLAEDSSFSVTGTMQFLNTTCFSSPLSVSASAVGATVIGTASNGQETISLNGATQPIFNTVGPAVTFGNPALGGNVISGGPCDGTGLVITLGH